VPELTFVGTGEAFDPSLPNTSLLYRGARTLLFDCGYGVPHAFWRLSQDPNLLDGVYITHLHADHSFGLPALFLWMREEGRTRPLQVFGGPGVARWLWRLLELGYPGAYMPDRCFSIEPVAVSPGSRVEWDGLAIASARSDHPVRNSSVRVEEEKLSFCYSGDGAPSAATRALYRGATVLVHECYSASEPVRGHATVNEVLELGDECGVGTLCLLHIGRRDKERVVQIAASHRSRMRVLVPVPGERLAVVENPT
jgi:ribonuclease BN (tRNA processing enzyme)